MPTKEDSLQVAEWIKARAIALYVPTIPKVQAWVCLERQFIQFVPNTMIAAADLHSPQAHASHQASCWMVVHLCATSALESSAMEVSLAGISCPWGMKFNVCHRGTPHQGVAEQTAQWLSHGDYIWVACRCTIPSDAQFCISLILNLHCKLLC